MTLFILHLDKKNYVLNIKQKQIIKLSYLYYENLSQMKRHNKMFFTINLIIHFFT